MKTTIPASLAQELIFGGEKDGWSWKAQEDGEDRRWSRANLTILAGPDGNYWGFYWEEGLTENQENEYPWGSSMRTVATGDIEVETYKPKEIKATIWVRSK